MGLIGEPSTVIQGARRIRRDELVPKGWVVVKQGSIYNHIQHLSLNNLDHSQELTCLRGGQKNLWLRLHSEDIINYFVRHGRELTKQQFRITKDFALDSILEGGGASDIPQFGKLDKVEIEKLDKVESQLEINTENVRDLRGEVRELREIFGLFEQSVGKQLIEKFFLPLLRRGIELNERFEKPRPKTIKVDDLIEEFVPAITGAGRDGFPADPLLGTARQLEKESKHISKSFLQRGLHIGYPRAARLMEQLKGIKKGGSAK